MRLDDEERLKQLLSQHQLNGHAYMTAWVVQFPDRRVKLMTCRPYPSPGESVPDDHVSRRRPAAPLPYAFAPSFSDPSAYRDPPTPTSLPDTNDSRDYVLEAKQYIDKLTDDLLAGSTTPHHNGNGTSSSHGATATAHTPSVNVTPTIARTLASTNLTSAEMESPDPIAMSGPSPSKRPRTTQRETSPTLAGSSTDVATTLPCLTTDPSQGQKRRPSSDGHSGTKRLVPEVVISTRAPAFSQGRSEHQTQIEDNEEDDLDWGDGPSSRDADADGDWQMGEAGYRSPSPSRAPISMGSGRTGERDQRCTSSPHRSFFGLQRQT